MKHFLLPATVLLVACPSATPAPVDADEPPAAESNNCEAKPEMAAEAKPKPVHVGCMDHAELTAIAAACNDGDPDKCWQAGSCFALELLNDEGDMGLRDSAKNAMRVACDEGMAEACMARAGLIQNQDTSTTAREEACKDAIRACHLGHKIGCADCVMCGAQ